MNQLVSKAKKGDQEAFIQLIEQNKQRMFRTAKAILFNDEDVADAMQDAILASFQAIGKLRHEAYFQTWLTRILINKCNDIIAKNGNLIRVDSPVESSNHDPVYCESLKSILALLPQDYRLLMVLYYGNGFSIKEISKMLKMNENTVKSRLARGRKAFQKAYFLNKEDLSYEY